MGTVDVKRKSNDLANGAKGLMKSAEDNPWVDRLARMGYVARGLIYGVVGILALQLIFNQGGKITGRTGALATIAAQPFGKVLLVVIAIGLVGMLIWGIVRAFADPYNKGTDLGGIAARTAYLVEGLSYGALLFPTLQLLNGSGSGSNGQQAQQTAAGILTKPWGPWFVGLVGLVLIGAGGYQIYQGIKGKLEERLKAYEMTAEQREIALKTGRFGYIAFGTVLAVIGILAVLAATTLNPQKIGGLDQALAFLAQQPYGPWLLGFVAFGLLAYAVYSFMGAIWFRIRGL